MSPKESQKNYPILFKSTEYLKNQANFFRESIPKLIENEYDFELAESVCRNGLRISSNDWDVYQKRLNNLIELSFDFLKLQVNLEKTGKYLYSSFAEVEKNVFLKNGKHEGPQYLWGLYFSEVFWKIHCKLTKFFMNEFSNRVNEEGTVLEVPIGTGFHLSQFLMKNPKWSGIGVDLTENAVKFSKNIFKINKIPKESYNIIKEDFFTFKNKTKFNRIICGEFLEHVENPQKVLNNLNGLLNKNGKIFLTAAVWSGGIDHIYLYTHPDEVRNHIKEAGFKIEKELVQAVLERDELDPEKGKIPVNYAAVLSK